MAMSEATPPPDSSRSAGAAGSSPGGEAHEVEGAGAPSSPIPPVDRGPALSEFTAPSPAGRARRPRYLVVALALSLFIGAGLWTEGCSTLAFYRGETDYKAVLDARIHDEANRARADERYEHFTEVIDAARNRVIPFSAAIFVLGTTMLVLSALALGGRNTRHALVQVVGVQAAVILAQYYATKDVRMAKLDWQLEGVRIQQQEALSPEEYEKVAPGLESARVVYGPLVLFLQTSASGLILLALTRRRSREFFDITAANAAD